jgi:hypothetical protein
MQNIFPRGSPEDLAIYDIKGTVASLDPFFCSIWKKYIKIKR